MFDFLIGVLKKMSRNRVTINGKTYDLPNGNISIINEKIYVNGEEFKTEEFKNDNRKIEITIEGDVGQASCRGSMNITGSVRESVDCGGSVSIAGDVNGDVNCGGSASVKGNVFGDIACGGSVSVGKQ